MSRIDLTSSQCQTAAGVQTVITNIANSGDEVHLAPGTFNWTAAVTNAGKNLSIIGAGPDQTTITGGQIFNLTAKLGDTNLLRLSGMTLNKPADNGATIAIGGTAVINENTFTGGFRLDHCIINASVKGYTLRFDGWIEGVVDHCIWDKNPITAEGGETIIVNHITSPTGQGSYGDYAWSIPSPDAGIPAGIHQLFFEDNIIHRLGGTDTNQFANGGGSTYASRHNTAWTELAGGHGIRESGGTRVTGHHSSEAYKNLWVRNAAIDASTDGNFIPIRSGSLVAWGNRYNAWGVSVGAASTPFVIFGYQRSSERNGDMFGGPNALNAFDENQKGAFTVNEALTANNGTSFALDSLYTLDSRTTSPYPVYQGRVIAGIDQDSQRGDVYAHGVGGSRAATLGSDITLNTGNNTTTNFAYVGTDHWADFVLINLDLDPTKSAAAQPVAFTYIKGNSLSVLHVDTNNVYGISQANQMTIGAGTHWEIRRVKTYFCCGGSGTMSAKLDSSVTGPHAAKFVAGTSPNPQWTQAVNDGGLWQWDNQYKVTSGANFQNIAHWVDMGGTQYAHLSRNRVDNVPKVGYPYSATVGSSGNRDTRVGADNEVWAFAPASVTNEASVVSGAADSFYDTGAGGFTYPHPLTQTNGVGQPFISGNSSATISTSSPGASTITTFTANNFSGAVTWGLHAGTWPSNVTLTSSTDPLLTATTGVLKTTSGFPSGNSAGDTDVTIRAQTSGGAQFADKTFKLTTTSPNVAPTDVAVTSPSNGDTFTAPATITLQSKATDSDGSIKSMEYFEGTNSIKLVDATQVAAPYEYIWTQVPSGTYSLKVKATDNQTGSTLSPTAVSITVNASPTLAAPNIVVSA